MEQVNGQVNELAMTLGLLVREPLNLATGYRLVLGGKPCPIRAIQFTLLDPLGMGICFGDKDCIMGPGGEIKLRLTTLTPARPWQVVGLKLSVYKFTAGNEIKFYVPFEGPQDCVAGKPISLTITLTETDYKEPERESWISRMLSKWKLCKCTVTSQPAG